MDGVAAGAGVTPDSLITTAATVAEWCAAHGVHPETVTIDHRSPTVIRLAMADFRRVFAGRAASRASNTYLAHDGGLIVVATDWNADTGTVTL